MLKNTMCYEKQLSREIFKIMPYLGHDSWFLFFLKFLNFSFSYNEKNYIF